MEVAQFAHISMQRRQTVIQNEKHRRVSNIINGRQRNEFEFLTM